MDAFCTGSMNKMKKFMDCNFLLKTDAAKELFHGYAAHMPIFDYHCHLSAKEIYLNQPAASIGELWLKEDHYKWRLMRANGIPESLITGNADYYEKFKAFAGTLQYAIGNPLYHWSHLELQRYFGINTILTEDTADEIWKQANAVMQTEDFSPQAIIRRSHVEGLCTTEDPVESLEYHRLLKESAFPVKILPAIRLDHALGIEKSTFEGYTKQLEKVSKQRIGSFADFMSALSQRMDAFQQAGCVASDHGLEYIPLWDGDIDVDKMELIFGKALGGKIITMQESDYYKGVLLFLLAKEYKKRDWVMELHVGCNRSQNTRMVEKVGESTGFDSIGDSRMALPIGQLLNALEKEEQLPKTILFTLNAKDNWVLSSLTGNYQNDEIPSKIQFGTAWWMQDHRHGMEQHMLALANLGLLGRFVGMLTDSRSLLSYPRHEYFRRILCNMVGQLIEDGEYSSNIPACGKIIEDICFNNAVRYFGVK